MSVEEERELRLRIEALEQAVVGADEAVRASEGVGLLHYMEYMENGIDGDSYSVIEELLGDGL